MESKKVLIAISLQFYLFAEGLLYDGKVEKNDHLLYIEQPKYLVYILFTPLVLITEFLHIKINCKL